MTNPEVDERIDEMNQKLDAIVEELGHLRRYRQSAEDLAADLSLVGKDAMGGAIEVCESLDFRAQDAVPLLKAVLANTKLLTQAVQQLESAADFVQDVQPIVRDIYQQAVNGSQLLEQKGYFRAAFAGVRIGDALVQSHSPEDLKQVEASVPQLIGFLRELTRPEVLQALEAIIHGFGRVQATMNVNKSAVEILRDLNSKDARRGIAIIVEFLKVVGAQSVFAQSKGPQKVKTER